LLIDKAYVYPIHQDLQVLTHYPFTVSKW